MALRRKTGVSVPPTRFELAYWNQLDGEIKTAFGETGEGYKLFHAIKDNLYTPGPNHEFVRHLNNGLNDIRQGPGPKQSKLEKLLMG